MREREREGGGGGEGKKKLTDDAGSISHSIMQSASRMSQDSLKIGIFFRY